MTEYHIAAETKAVKQSTTYNVQWKISDFDLTCESVPTLNLDCDEVAFLKSVQLRIENLGDFAGEDGTLLKIHCVPSSPHCNMLYMNLTSSVECLIAEGFRVDDVDMIKLGKSAKGGEFLGTFQLDYPALFQSKDEQGNMNLGLKITLYITPFETSKDASSHLVQAKGSKVEMNQLTGDLKKALHDGQDFDFTFTFPEENDDKLFAHKLVLKARSPYFADMLKSGMREQVENEVEVVDISRRCMKILLEFMYTDEMKEEDFTSCPKELVYAADKFRMEGLMDVADALLSCTKENEHEMLALAKMHRLRKAERRIKEFIKSSI